MAAEPLDDYYQLLGIDPHADDEEIRRVWKKVALRWHPDRAGPDATAMFQMLSDAFAILCDPELRAAYDRKLGIRRSAPPLAPMPIRRKAPGVLQTRISRPLETLLAMGVAHVVDDETIELRLDPVEATEGGMVTIPMQVAVCRECADKDEELCVHRPPRATGEERFSAWLAIPPDVEDGAVIHPSVLLRGMLRPISFRVRR